MKINICVNCCQEMEEGELFSLDGLCNKCRGRVLKEESGNDMKLNPPYYSRFKIEPIDFINANGLDYMTGNVIKYVCRYPYKGQPVEDLNKAISYLQKMLKKAEEDATKINGTGQAV